MFTGQAVSLVDWKFGITELGNRTILSTDGSAPLRVGALIVLAQPLDMVTVSGSRWEVAADWHDYSPVYHFCPPHTLGSPTGVH